MPKPKTVQQQSRVELFEQIMKDLGGAMNEKSSLGSHTNASEASVTLTEILDLLPIRAIPDDAERTRVIARKLEFCTIVPSLPEWVAQTDYHQRVVRWLRQRHALALDSLRTMVTAPDECAPDAADASEQVSKRRTVGDERGTPGGMYVGLLGHNSARAGSIEQQPSPRLRTSHSAPALGQLANADDAFESRSALRSVVERFTRLGTGGYRRQETSTAKEEHLGPQFVRSDAMGSAATDSPLGTLARGHSARELPALATSPNDQALGAASSATTAGFVGSRATAPPLDTLPETKNERSPQTLIQTPADLMDLKRAVLADLLDAAEHARQHGSSAFTGHWIENTSTPSPRMPFVFQITPSGTALERPVRDAGMSASSWSCRSQTCSSFFSYALLPQWIQFFSANLFRPLPLRKRLAEPEYLSERETPTLHYVPERTSRDSGARPGSPGPTEGVAARGLAADMDYVVFVDDELTNPLDFLDPVWSHLELVYSLFIEFSLCRIGQVPDDVHLGEELASKYFTRRFIRSLQSLFVSEDPRERDALRTVTHRLYARYAPLRTTMRQVMAEVVFARPVAEDDTFRQIAWLPHCVHAASMGPETSASGWPMPATCSNLPESAALAADNGLYARSTDIFLAGSHPAALCSGLSYNGVSEALDILAAIVAGFSVPLREEHRLYFRRVLLPMHKARGLARYHRELTMCVVFFVSKDISLGVEAIRALLRYWPRTSARKELLFLTEINDILTACGTVLNRRAEDSSRRSQWTSQRCRRTTALASAQGTARLRQGTASLATLLTQFAALVPELFTRLAKCISSAQLDVSERAIYMVSNQELLGELVEKYRAQVYPIMVPAVWRTSKEHWSLEVRHMANVLARLLQQLDADRFAEFQPNETTF
jgi:hypothetical protein